MSEVIIADCGLVCSSCGAYRRGRCTGCHGGKPMNSRCGIKVCVKDHGYTTCAECKDMGDLKKCRKLNNIISKIRKIGLKGIRERSVVGYNLLWENAQNMTDCNLADGTLLTGDPKLDDCFSPGEESSAIDAGVSKFEHRGEIVLDKDEQSYVGKSIDVGAVEYGKESWLEEILNLNNIKH